MDFYTTKYQGKPMESLTPLFQSMVEGVRRLELQEQQEEEKAAAADQNALEAHALEPRQKVRKTKEEMERRARRLTIRLASMANRCFWISAAELTVHILTGGDCLQSHNNLTIFTRQLQWAMHQCKRLLNHEAEEDQPEQVHSNVETVAVHIRDDEKKDSAEAQEPGEVGIDKIEATTHSTNVSDDYAHRGSQLSTMAFYVYRMYVRRISKPSRAKCRAANIFFFEPHYALSRSYAQEVVLHNMNVPSIDGFQCPTLEQDPEQNALLKAMLFTPWVCTDPLNCGSVHIYRHLLSNNDCLDQTVGGASQPAGSGAGPAKAPRRYTFQRAWEFRKSEIQVLAQRAECRCLAARKKLVLADTTLFAEMKEPTEELEQTEEIMDVLKKIYTEKLRRTPPGQGVRGILAFLGKPCRWHEEQCTLAEYSAYISRDVMVHIDLAAEARVKKNDEQMPDVDSSDCSEDEASAPRRAHPEVELVDIGGGVMDELEADIPEAILGVEISSYPLMDISHTLSLCLQQDCLAALDIKKRKSKSDLDLKALDETYCALLRHNVAMDAAAPDLRQHGFPKEASSMISLQKRNIELAKKQQSTEPEAPEEEDEASMFSGASQPAEAEWVPLPLAQQGPAVVAWKLLTDAECTKEQIDAVSLLAHSLQKRFEARPDKSTLLLPLASAANNHRAVWLGGGGVGKTRTLSKVVQPLAETFFGPNGYSATAQSNHAAQNLGSKGRTMHSANGLLLTDSMKTARLRLNSQTQKKMDRLAGDLGVDVIDELGAVPSELLHADALRKSYGRAPRHGLNALAYMKPQETWGRMPAKILCGDFCQLPPVPAKASLIADPAQQSYEFQQGRKLLMDMEHVIDFVQMQRFTDPLLVEVLAAMRTPGGRKISNEAWQAIVATKIQQNGQDDRLKDARHWYECAYEWRIVSYAMHAHARLNARAAGKVLYYIPAIDVPAVRMSKKDFDDMRALPNLNTTSKLPGILAIYIGMEMILEEFFLPPHIVRGTPVKVVDIELHDAEPKINGRPSIASHGCVVLTYMPKCIYVRLDNGCKTIFLNTEAGASQPGCIDLQGVLAVQPKARPWRYKSKSMEVPVSVTRTQCPLLPRKQCTLHGIQGKTADPGFIAHWSYPVGLTKEQRWLAYYVSLSRPRAFANMLSHGLPEREIIESGPPESITKTFDEFFKEKITATKRACVDARAAMGWPPRGTTSR